MTKNRLNLLTISPSILLPENNSRIQPGDLSKFAPYGNGFYGYEENSFKPIIGAPEQEPSGGIIYFGNRVKEENFKGFLEMMKINGESKDYAAFIKESSDPFKDKYYKQMRLVPKFALEFMFDQKVDSMKEQELSMTDAFLEFMKAEEERCGTCFWDPVLSRTMGGDGYWAREELSFGFMLENEYHGISRIWSRAWLVTK
jgi:hypothetical protein